MSFVALFVPAMGAVVVAGIGIGTVIKRRNARRRRRGSARNWQKPPKTSSVSEDKPE